MADAPANIEEVQLDHENRKTSLGGQSRYFILLMITLVCSANYLNRQVLTVLLEPIRRELALSDTQVGFLNGIAFTFINVTLAVPVARLADRWSRRKVIVIAVTFSSAMAILCGLAQNFLQLFIARFGVGAGQSGNSAPAHAFVGDLFPREQRATAISILLLSTSIGIALGFLWGGWALGEFGWRRTFILGAIPGLVIGVVALFTLPESQKGMSDGVRSPLPQPPFYSVIEQLWGIRSLRNMTFACSLQTFLQMGLTSWIPSFLMRSYKLPPATVGTGMAIAFGAGLTIGGMVGGRLLDVLGRRDLRWHFWIPTVAVVLAAGSSAIAFVVPPHYFFVLIGLQIFFGSLFASALTAITQALVPIAIRATAIACLLFIINSVAMGIGPQFIGIASDLLHPAFGDDSLRIALLGSAIVSLPAAFFYYRANRTYKTDIAVADARNKALSLNL